jgi:hypothetical protein
MRQRPLLRRKSKLHGYLAAALCALALLACGRGFEPATPGNFVELEEEESKYDYRAISADGLVLAVREIDHDPKGDLAFWVRAVENQMRRLGGYALIDQKDAKSADGVAGKVLHFGHDEGGRPHLYHVAVYVTDDDIYVLEAGGTKELMDRHAKDVEAAFANFRAD